MLKLAVLSCGVWVSFVAFGWAQETLTSHEYGATKERFVHTSSLVLLQSVGNAIVAYIALLATQGSKVTITGGVPTRDWLIAALGYLGAHKSGLEALKYIIFPLQVVAKSCKSIPVMAGEMVIANVKHSPTKRMSVLLLTLGVIVFTLTAPAKKGAEAFSLDRKTVIGLGLVLVALVCDGIYGPYQNMIASKYKCSEFHLMLNMNLWQGLFALLLIAPSGELQECAAFIVRHPSVLQQMSVFCCTMALGNIFIFKLQHDFGALTVTKITTIRKLVSVLFSVVWFGHAMAHVQWVGVFIVFFADRLAKAACLTLGLEKPTAAAAKKTI
ncbi:solute carrier family 35 member B1-like protein [Pavlovales sp. CCMP2436]|nr:solute carrier family 35 member B1-like protein [Pavlovales sp. CCMP2436]